VDYWKDKRVRTVHHLWSVCRSSFSPGRAKRPGSWITAAVKSHFIAQVRSIPDRPEIGKSESYASHSKLKNGAPEYFNFKKRLIVGWERIHLVQFRHLGERTSKHIGLLPFVIRKICPGGLTDSLPSSVSQTVLKYHQGQKGRGFGVGFRDTEELWGIWTGLKRALQYTCGSVSPGVLLKGHTKASSQAYAKEPTGKTMEPRVAETHKCKPVQIHTSGPATSHRLAVSISH
jgi:hypothetical protein